MKVGDLVKLSAYGKKRQWNIPLTVKDTDIIGLIVKYHPNGAYGYTVQWPIRLDCPYHSRRELKYAY